MVVQCIETSVRYSHPGTYGALRFERKLVVSFLILFSFFTYIVTSVNLGSRVDKIDY